MRKINDHFLVVVVVLAIVCFVACGDSPSSTPQNQVVKQKIEGQNVPAKASPNPATSPATTPPTASKSGSKDGNSAMGDANATKANGEPSALVKASLEFASEYDPKGRFDPFEPLFKEESTEPVMTKKGKRKKRIPQTPLERVAIGQLKLSAVMRMSRGNSAIVEDATGKGYVVRKGTYIGLNSGQVIQIQKDRVVIEEEIENVMGELIIQNTELKLQKPAGEL